MFFSHKKTSPMSPDHTSSVHTHHRGSRPQKFEILTFSQSHPMTFGLCLGIITDTFHGVFEYFFRNLFFIIFLIICHSNNPNNPSNILKNFFKIAKTRFSGPMKLFQAGCPHGRRLLISRTSPRPSFDLDQALTPDQALTSAKL